MKLTILLISILLIGCTTLTIEEKESICKKECLSDGWEYGTFVGVNFCNCYNRTIIINSTITINNTININTTCTQSNYTPKERELELIRRLSFCEGQIDKLIINETECMPHNITEEKLQNCENKIDMYERDIDELEEEIEDCEEELCEWNSTWC